MIRRALRRALLALDLVPPRLLLWVGDVAVPFATAAERQAVGDRARDSRLGMYTESRIAASCGLVGIEAAPPAAPGAGGPGRLAAFYEHVHNRTCSGGVMSGARPVAPESPSAPESLRERNKREKRERIRRAARELFERKGFEAATAREIAARARVGLGTLFLYARDKRDLLFLVFEDASQRLFQEGREAARRTGGLVEALMVLFGRFHAFYARQPELSGALLREFFFQPYEPERVGALSRSYLEHVAELVAGARDRGELRDDVPVEAAAHGLFAHYAYWTQAWLGARAVSRAEADRRLRAALALQIEGLRPAAPARGAPRRPRHTRPPRRTR